MPFWSPSAVHLLVWYIALINNLYASTDEVGRLASCALSRASSRTRNLLAISCVISTCTRDVVAAITLLNVFVKHGHAHADYRSFQNRSPTIGGADPLPRYLGHREVCVARRGRRSEMRGAIRTGLGYPIGST
jgi:hypothetical protein